MIKTRFWKCVFLTGLFAATISIPVTGLQAEEVDFSCMDYRVRSKIQVNEHLKEYDIAIENHCPGSVFWSMCIERMDPWSNKIQEPLMPSGILQMEKKSRVNLQLKKRYDESRSRRAFGEFYVNIGYALQPPVSAKCIASGCESKRRSLRTKFWANDAAWQKAKKALVDRLSIECPPSGWDTGAQDECKSEIRAANQVSMDRFAQKEEELMSSISAIDPELCEVHGGG